MTNNPETMPETYHIQKLKAVSVQLSAIGRADLAFTVLTNVEHLQSIIQNTRANDTLAEENKRLRGSLNHVYAGNILPNSEIVEQALNQTKGS